MALRSAAEDPPGGPLPLDAAAALEARVATLLAAGNQADAVRALIEGYGPQIHGYLRSLLAEPEAADDAFSLWAENVWRGLSSWRRASSARTWCYRVAWNAASRLHRDPWRRRRARLVTAVVSELAARVLSTSRRSLERRADALVEVRATLTQEEQSLLFLRVDRDLPWAEVAEVMAAEGAPLDLPRLRKRFERLRAKIARIARERGLLKPD